jgi:hypothetical protein
VGSGTAAVTRGIVIFALPYASAVPVGGGSIKGSNLSLGVTTLD